MFSTELNLSTNNNDKPTLMDNIFSAKPVGVQSRMVNK